MIYGDYLLTIYILVEAAHSYGRGSIGFKSKALKARQEGNTPEVIAYADKANEMSPQEVLQDDPKMRKKSQCRQNINCPRTCLFHVGNDDGRNSMIHMTWFRFRQGCSKAVPPAAAGH